MIDYYRRELGHVNDVTRIMDLKKRLDLTAQQTRLVLSLYDLNQRFVTDTHLLDAIESGAENPVLIRVIVSSVRRKLGKGSIESERGRLFRLPLEGRAIVDKAKMGAAA